MDSGENENDPTVKKYFEVLKLIRNNVSRGIMDGLTV
jgi:hypothetical protein